METLIKVVGLLVLVALAGLIFTYPLMVALNYVFAPSLLMTVFGVAKLTFWRTYFFSMVMSSLFKSVSAK